MAAISHCRKIFRFNRIHFFQTSAAAADAKETGLYGFPHLKTPNGFQRFVDDAIERAGELVNHISTMPSSAEIIRAMDEISDTVCSVVDSAELCRHTHPNREFVEQANVASMRMDEYLHFLNTNHNLYNAVMKAELEGNVVNKETQRAAHYLRVDFEKGGIHLCDDKLERVNQLNMDIAQLCRKFNANIADDPGYVDIHPAIRIPKRMRHIGMPICCPAGSSTKGCRLATDPVSLISILQLVSDAEVRKLAYIQGNSVPHANLDVLDKLIAARHELAQIMGYKSYAEFSASPNMASSVDVVMSFLHELSSMVKPKADEEFVKLRDYKRRQMGQIFTDLEPWDETYYSAMLKGSNFDLDSSVIASYFPLPQCIEGLKLLVESLFGATFRNIPLAPGESWHPDVLKMSLHHPEEVVALVCNFSNNPSTVRLNHGEVETLFHEFGHALHSLLSRTEYQHFSGTRVALDLAETPSNLFEYYAWDYRVLKTFAKHYLTGETIPKKLVDSMRGAKKMFAATELQRQIFYAMIDQKLFGEQDSPPRDTISIVSDLKRQYTSYKQVEGTHWHTRFSHLLNYGGGYYSYLYAKCLAAAIWKNVCEEDPLSLKTGTALRTKFLQHGGAVEPVELLIDLAGEGSIRYSNGGVIPDIKALSEEMNIP
ncbi:mitochondrial intermediate peptidase, mitochondrial isoform X2 [Spinacia oleracea]|uniref:Mitochondrial intermediate peptidase, mitochondrial isoform X2 n=1 Tax=Spinacia oleracea TaxID=3562 RepID=A0A9R0JPH5_SPIOL|nr:mitochondrial intermediate peptidase, mitochondrial isoform X2 [Spinacia oleracea]